MHHQNTQGKPENRDVGMFQMPSLMNNELFRRATGVLAGAATRLFQPRVAPRMLCTAADPVGCGGTPTGALEALLRLAALPEARADEPPVPSHPLKKAADDAKRNTLAKEGRQVRYPAADRIIAVGDVHGDVGALRQVLSKAGVLGVDGSWSGGRTVLVQVGDQLDRGDGE
eukprot:IDg15784t1